jgi:hypothetical protein
MAQNRVIYIMILFMTAAFVFLFEHRATYTALYAVLLMPAASLTLLLAAKRFISFTEKIGADTVKKNEAARYIICVKNNNFFGFRAKAVFNANLRRFIKISNAGVLYLPPRKNGEIVTEMLCGYRGTFAVSAEYILIYDWFGLFKVRIKNPGCLNLTVLPDIYNLPSLPVSLRNPADSPGADGMMGEDYSDFPDLKKYSPADGHKRIHWQLSAMRGELISKNFNSQPKPASAVIIDNSQFKGRADIKNKIKDKKRLKDKIEDMRGEDGIIEAAVSVMAYCIEAGTPVYLDYMGVTPGAISGRFDELYVSASGIAFGEEEDFGDFLAGTLEKRRDAGNIYIFTRTVTDFIIDCAERLRSSGRNALIFYYTEGECKLWAN